MDSDDNPSGRGESHPPKRTGLVPKKGSHSTVWKYFGFKPEDDKQCEVHRKVCFSLVAAPQGNTTDVSNHLKRHHKVQHDETIQRKKQRQASKTGTMQRLNLQQEITAPGQRYGPINTAQHQGFQGTMNTQDALPQLLFKRCSPTCTIRSGRGSRQNWSDLWSSRTTEPYLRMRLISWRLISRSKASCSWPRIFKTILKCCVQGHRLYVQRNSHCFLFC